MAVEGEDAAFRDSESFLGKLGGCLAEGCAMGCMSMTPVGAVIIWLGHMFWQ